MKIRVGPLSSLSPFWLVSNLITRTSCSAPEQLIISSPDTSSPVDNSNLIFASFAGLLQQWPNTFAYSGHSIIPGLIPRSTLLYHSRHDPSGPPTEGLEWLAFDPEMSYSIGSHRPGQLDLYTFVADRALRVIYLDGQSASLGTPGFMDAQYALINASVPKDFPDKGRYLEAEYARATELCKIGDKYGFEGVVRMNTGFELIWCDFKKGIHLLDMVNATDPYSAKISPFKIINQVNSNSDLPDKRPVPQSPFYSRASWSFSSSGARHFFPPGEVRVILDPAGFISFYDGLESLEFKRQADGTSSGPRSRHRLYGISSEDAKTVRRRLVEVLERKNFEDWRMDPGQSDWRSLVLIIVERFSPPIRELRYLLNRADLSATKKAIEVRGLAYDIIMPSLDFSEWDHQDLDWLSRGIRRCTSTYTSARQQLPELNHSIHIIIQAIEGTLGRICQTIYSLFSQTIQLSLPLEPSFSFNSTLESLAQSKIPIWHEQVKVLQKWLGWPTWDHCEPLCRTNEICMPPMWPYLWGKVITNLTDQFPICLNSSSTTNSFI
ncbi:hypothetical protein PGT21_001468 [Puccinia graminis f. sp. tritici]|uniref:Uncharacterized protein n=1 Tax=Puccinia graminis f. sp. tritici TaxID=56615 RepID=A0A5B0N4X5_PUCGR|nr:hypothetical protein PGT21_001468 [Puccinia graminis f. sp. tritici]KAA1123415.1 hypothetical protein PGTUg99_021502 [Puccinia graminis f. sp. tritici]